jgi:hypothetical protein
MEQQQSENGEGKVCSLILRKAAWSNTCSKCRSLVGPLTVGQLRLKVAEMVEIRDNPFRNGIPGASYVGFVIVIPTYLSNQLKD